LIFSFFFCFVGTFVGTDRKTTLLFCNLQQLSAEPFREGEAQDYKNLCLVVGGQR